MTPISVDWLNEAKLAETIGSVWNLAYPFFGLVIAILLFLILFEGILNALGRFLNVFFYGDSGSESDSQSIDYDDGGGPDIENNLKGVTNMVRGNQIDEQILWDRPHGFTFPAFSLPQFFRPGLVASTRSGYQAETYGHNQAESYGSNQAELYGGQSTSQVEPVTQTPMEQPANSTSLTDHYPILRLVRLTGWLKK